MARLLYIEASPRKDMSSSIKVARVFIEEYHRTHPDDVVDILDLWQTDLPEFDGDVINAKYAILHGDKLTEEQKKAWVAVEKVIDNFKKTDKYLISLPMWNFGIPYKLKHYFDVIVQPGYTFSYTPEKGYMGLVTGKPVTVIYARGGSYSSGTGAESYDLQKGYMDVILQFIGFTEIKSIIIEPMLMVTHEEKAGIIEVANESARKMSGEF
jgi:FMN-dependent NADH-azoreductase